MSVEKEILQTYKDQNDVINKMWDKRKEILDSSMSWLNARGEWDEYVDGFESQQTINEKRMNLEGQWKDAEQRRKELEDNKKNKTYEGTEEDY